MKASGRSRDNQFPNWEYGGCAGACARNPARRTLSSSSSFRLRRPVSPLSPSCMPPNRSEYQPLTQSVDEEEDVSEGLNPQPARGLRRAQRPVHIDLSKLDSAFKRYACCHTALYE